jgi:hypothetical protein
MDQIEFYLMDPARGRMRYGALSAITNVLWLQLIRKLQEPGVRPAEVLQHYGVDFGSNEASDADDNEDEGEDEDA